jgi:hypothetical protein
MSMNGIDMQLFVFGEDKEKGRQGDKEILNFPFVSLFPCSLVWSCYV